MLSSCIPIFDAATPVLEKVLKKLPDFLRHPPWWQLHTHIRRAKHNFPAPFPKIRTSLTRLSIFLTHFPEKMIFLLHGGSSSVFWVFWESSPNILPKRNSNRPENVSPKYQNINKDQERMFVKIYCWLSMFIYNVALLSKMSKNTFFPEKTSFHPCWSGDCWSTTYH